MENEEAVFRAEEAPRDIIADISAASTKNSKKQQKASKKPIFRRSVRIANKGKKIPRRSNRLARKKL